MKILLTFLLICMISLKLSAQKIVYDDQCKKKTFSSESLELDLTESTVKMPGKQIAGALLSALPTAVDIGFRLAENHLKNRVAKFSAEYTKQQSYLSAGKGNVPNVLFTRKTTIAGSPDDALVIDIQPEAVTGVNAFVYVVKNINLKYSGALSKPNAKTFDYTIELKISLLVDGKKEVQEPAPIVVSSVTYGTNSYANNKNRSEMIMLPEKAVVTDVSIKVIESNPHKLRAEKVLKLWTDNKDDVKTIVNNFLPKEKEEKKEEDGAAAAPKPDANADSSSGVNKSKPKQQNN